MENLIFREGIETKEEDLIYLYDDVGLVRVVGDEFSISEDFGCISFVKFS